MTPTLYSQIVSAAITAVSGILAVVLGALVNGIYTRMTQGRTLKSAEDAARINAGMTKEQLVDSEYRYLMSERKEEIAKLEQSLDDLSVKIEAREEAHKAENAVRKSTLELEQAARKLAEQAAEDACQELAECKDLIRKLRADASITGAAAQMSPSNT